MCMLALIVLLQGAAVAVFIVLGPAHLHKSEAPPLVLVDFRRWKPSAPAPAPSAFLTVLAHGHGHGTLQTQRHYHAVDDSSVRPRRTERQRLPCRGARPAARGSSMEPFAHARGAGDKPFAGLADGVHRAAGATTPTRMKL
jgi:hypothetical protein